MAQIHSTAFIDPQAQLADDVYVGPNCSIQGKVTIAAGTHLIGNAYLQGPMTVGQKNLIYPFACLGFAPQHRGFDPKTEGAGLVIGSHNVFREYVTIHRAFKDKPTTIGDHNFFMATSHVGHDCVVGSNVTLANSVLIAGHVNIGDGVTFGGNAAIHQFCNVGRLTIVSGMTALIHDIPPFMLIRRNSLTASLNLVGLRRAGLRDHIRPLQKAFEIAYRRRLPNSRSAQIIRAELGDDPLCVELADFLATTERGIVPHDAAANEAEINKD